MDPARLAEIDTVLDAALTLDAGERAEFLERRCAGDPALRRDVEALLARAGAEPTAVERPLRAFVAAAAGAAPAVEPDPLPPGTLVGAWRVVRTLGRGGMGVVALAERVDGRFEHRVAIKVLPGAAGTLTSPEAVRRFERERQILARLAHPHIAHLLDGGVDARGLPYLVMEHVEGARIDEHCDARRLGIEARLRLLIAIARAVQAAHRALVVHRDIKPANVLVAADGTVKLLDFGIARLLEPGDGDGVATVTAGHLLTPSYASPEQVRGLPIATASDVYQLGLLLHELVTGVRAQPATAASLADLVAIVCERDPEPPSRAALATAAGAPTPEERAALRSTTPARLARRCRGDLDAIVARALAKDPERRYASAGELAADLERHLDGRPVRARRATWRYRALRFVRRNAAATTVAALAALLTAGYAAATTLQARATARARDRAELEARKAREVERFVLGLFDVADPSESRGRSVTVRELLDAGAARVDRELAGEPEVQARMLSTLGHVTGRLGLYPEGIALQRRALALRRKLFGEHHVETAESVYRLGTLLRKQGAEEEAGPLVAEAVALLRELRPGSLELAEALAELGSWHYQKGDYDTALAVFTENLAVRRALGEPETVAAGLNNMGLVHGSRGDDAQAARYYREALALNRRAFGDRSPAVGVNLFNLGRALQGMEDWRAAQPVFEEVLAIDSASYGRDHPEVALDETLVANNLVKLGELERAEPLFAHAFEIFEAKLDPAHPRIATALQGIGQLRLAQGRLAESEAALRRALALRRTRYGPSHALVAGTLLPLGECLAAQGRGDEATAVWREALPMVEGGKQPKLAAKLRAVLAGAWREDAGVAAAAARRRPVAGRGAGLR